MATNVDDRTQPPPQEAWDLLQSTLSRFLGDSSRRAEAARSFELTIPTDQREDLAAVLATQGSYRDAVLVQLAYAVTSPGLDATIRAPGARTTAGKLGRFLTQQHIKAVRDAFQNIGKNSTALVRGNFPSWDSFLTWASTARQDQLLACLEYACSEVASLARPVQPMPELNVARLTFGRVMGLYQETLARPSGGAHEQYIVASLLEAFVQQSGLPAYRVDTKRPNASDLSARVAGDVQIMVGNRTLEAYEVTAGDWHTKLGDVSAKLKERDLARIHVVSPLRPAAHAAVVHELAGLPEDVSVLDIHGFASVLLSSLTRASRAVALRRFYEMLDRYLDDASIVNTYVGLLTHHGLTSSLGEQVDDGLTKPPSQ